MYSIFNIIYFISLKYIYIHSYSSIMHSVGSFRAAVVCRGEAEEREG